MNPTEGHVMQIAASLSGPESSRCDRLEAISGLDSWSFDLDSGQLTLSHQAARLLPRARRRVAPGFERAQLLERIARPERARAASCWRGALAGTPFEVEYRLKREGLGTRWISAVATRAGPGRGDGDAGLGRRWHRT
jgi:PAS domain-containing protein